MNVVIPVASRNTNETLLECVASIQLEITGPRDHPGVSPLLIGRVIMEVVMTLVMTLVIPLFTLVITWAWAMLWGGKPHTSVTSGVYLQSTQDTLV